MVTCISHRLQVSTWNIEALLGYIDQGDKSRGMWNEINSFLLYFLVCSLRMRKLCLPGISNAFGCLITSHARPSGVFWLCIQGFFLHFLKLLEKHKVLARSGFFTSCLMLKLLSGFPNFSGNKGSVHFDRNRSWTKALSALLCVGRVGIESESE